jgi:hypothetical protein
MARIDVVPITHAGWAAVLLQGLLKSEWSITTHFFSVVIRFHPARLSEHIFLTRYSPVIFFLPASSASSVLPARR